MRTVMVVPNLSITDDGWISASVGGNCVELAALEDGEHIAIRNSRNPNGLALIYTRKEIETMIEGAKAGVFDRFI